jgi:hypothetical protein
LFFGGLGGVTREHMRATFLALSEETCSQGTFLAVLSTAAGGVRSLREAGGPDEPLRALLQKVSGVSYTRRDRSRFKAQSLTHRLLRLALLCPSFAPAVQICVSWLSLHLRYHHVTWLNLHVQNNRVIGSNLHWQYKCVTWLNSLMQ